MTFLIKSILYMKHVFKNKKFMEKAQLLILACASQQGEYKAHIAIAVVGCKDVFQDGNEFNWKCDKYLILPELSTEGFEDWFTCSETCIKAPVGYIVGPPTDPLEIHF